MPKTQADYQQKYHDTRMNRSIEERAAYVNRRREIEKESKRRRRQKKKEENSLRTPHDQRLAVASEVEVVDQTPRVEWRKKLTNVTSELPLYDKGKLYRCPNLLKGENAMAAIILEGLSEFLQEEWHSLERNELSPLANLSLPSTTGIRKITGGRYEFYVLVKGSTPAAFKTLLQYSEKLRRKDPHLDLSDDDLGKLIGMIVGFATERARSCMIDSSYVFQNFAYIVSFGVSAEQDVHIDLGYADQYQMGILCTPKGQLTLEYTSEGSQDTVEQGEKLSKVWKHMPIGMNAKLDKMPEIQELIDGFGSLLSSSIKKVDEKASMVTFGDMLTLPGRVMHCAPSVMEEKQLRSVLFLTATHETQLASAYDSETQYCRSTIIHDILFHSWPSLNPKEKCYILAKWVQVALRQDSEDAILVNMNHQHLIVIASALKKETNERNLNSLILRIANDPRWKRKNHRQSWYNENDKVYKIPK